MPLAIGPGGSAPHEPMERKTRPMPMTPAKDRRRDAQAALRCARGRAGREEPGLHGGSRARRGGGVLCGSWAGRRSADMGACSCVGCSHGSSGDPIWSGSAMGDFAGEVHDDLHRAADHDRRRASHSQFGAGWSLITFEPIKPKAIEAEPDQRDQTVFGKDGQMKTVMSLLKLRPGLRGRHPGLRAGGGPRGAAAAAFHQGGT